MKLKTIIIGGLIVILGLIACTEISVQPVNYGLYELPPNFPNFESPDGNELTAIRIELGRKLFYDPILSRDSSVSCGTCHKQECAFADSFPTTPGIENRPGLQNVPSLGNIAYATSLTRAGGVPTLEMQILVPIQEHNEFDFNMLPIVERVSKVADYDSLSHLAYNRAPDPFVITRSIAVFERTLLTTNSPYDLYTYYEKKDAISSSAKRGMDLFMGDKADCSKCHTPPHFSNFSFENNAIHEVYADSGRMRLTSLEADRALFKVASLRNVALTAPYMHDGSMLRLVDVINHYNDGGFVHVNKSTLIRPLGLTEQEKADLLAFLEALTDESFINNPVFANPY